MNAIGKVLVYAGVISLFIGYVGTAFCGFAVSFLRGIRNLIIPFVAFGDAMRRFPILLWFWGGGIAGIVIGCLLVD